MNIHLISKLVIVLLLVQFLSACAGSAKRKLPPPVVFSENAAEVQAGASVTPENLVLNKNLRQVRYATCVAEQLSLTKGGARMVQGFLNTTQTGYRESQYVNGYADWKDNLKIGGALGFLQYVLSRRAENQRVAQNVSLAESNCGRMISSIIKMEADADAAFQAKLNTNINLYNVSQKASSDANTYLCGEMKHSRFCGSK